MVEYECEGAEVYHQWQCYTIDPDVGGRGVTYWGFPNGYSVDIPPNGTADFSYTVTLPECYSGKDNNNIYFYVKANANNNPDVPLRYYLNGNDEGGCRISGVAEHGSWQGVDISQCGSYDEEIGVSTFSIVNQSPVTVNIQDFKMMRVYEMCNILNDVDGQCEPGSLCPPMSESIATGNLDADNSPYVGRRDFPCNCDAEGSISFTTYNNEDFSFYTIPAGDTLVVDFDWGAHSQNNYIGGSVCLFNFNQIVPETTSSNSDVTLTAYLNDNYLTTYYLSNQDDHGLAPSYDLMESPYYDDDGANTIKLVNESDDVSVVLTDLGGINVYRTFRTTPVTCFCTCQTCQNCYTCQTCEEGCEITCEVGCEVSCQVGCEVCEVGCEVSCQTGCEVSCQVGCEICETACEVACQVICEYCQTCYPCYICYTCMTCQSACELSCQTGCEVSCQTGCEVSCQTGCEVSCQTACDTSCQDCQTCYPCFVCYSWYT